MGGHKRLVDVLLVSVAVLLTILLLVPMPVRAHAAAWVQGADYGSYGQCMPSSFEYDASTGTWYDTGQQFIVYNPTQVHVLNLYADRRERQIALAREYLYKWSWNASAQRWEWTYTGVVSSDMHAWLSDEYPTAIAWLDSDGRNVEDTSFSFLRGNGYYAVRIWIRWKDRWSGQWVKKYFSQVTNMVDFDGISNTNGYCKV